METIFRVARPTGGCSWSRRLVGLLVGLSVLTAAIVEGAEQAARPKLSRGFSYRNDRVEEVPWSIHIVQIERGNPDFELHTMLAKGTAFGMSTVSEQIKALPPELGRPIAAINGDFFRNERTPYQGDPTGLQILQGELVSGPCERSCFWIDAAGNPHMTNVLSQFKITWPDGGETPFGLNEERTKDGAVLYSSALGASTHAAGGRELILERDGDDEWLPLRAGKTYHGRVREVRDNGDTPLTNDIIVLSLGPQLVARLQKVEAGAVLGISTATIPDLGGANTAIGGGPALVRNGKPMEWHNMQMRHPRTAIGWNSHYFFLVEVDGRQRNLSVGMTFPELASYMAKLGCDEALNLDGGGSATCWVYGQVVNSPSEGRERPDGNSLVVVRKEKPAKRSAKPE